MLEAGSPPPQSFPHGAERRPHGHVRRGYFNVNASADSYGNLPDTYINVGKGGWAKGVAFINGFNLVCPPWQSACCAVLLLHVKC